MSSAVVPTTANKSNDNSDSDIEVVKELPSPPRPERNAQRLRNAQNGSYPSNQFHAGNGVGGNNVSVYTGQSTSHPSIQIVNGPYDRLVCHRPSFLALPIVLRIQSGLIFQFSNKIVLHD